MEEPVPWGCERLPAPLRGVGAARARPGAGAGQASPSVLINHMQRDFFNFSKCVQYRVVII